MYCTNCGKEIDDKAVVCPHCGVATDNYVELEKVAEPTKKVNGLGIAGFVVGLSSLAFGIYLLIACIVGLVLSIIAVKNKPKCGKCNGLATAGLIISIVSMALWTLWWGMMFKFIFTPISY